jgi:hypothetical protein
MFSSDARFLTADASRFKSGNLGQAVTLPPAATQEQETQEQANTEKRFTPVNEEEDGQPQEEPSLDKLLCADIPKESPDLDVSEEALDSSTDDEDSASSWAEEDDTDDEPVLRPRRSVTRPARFRDPDWETWEGGGAITTRAFSYTGSSLR